MTQTEQKNPGTRVIDSVQEAEQSALEAVRKFVDTVDGVFPDMSTDDGPRRKIIDSAFKMVENLVSTSNQFAENVLELSARAIDDSSTASAGKK